jgi:hypothetical protein
MAAKMLADAGFDVVLLAAGPEFDSASGDMFKWPYESSRRITIWDGPIKEVMEKMGLEYDPKLLPQ